MNIYEMKIGTRLELEQIDSMDEKAGQTYVSQLIDVVNEEEFVISCPIFESKFVFIPIGRSIRILLMHEKYGPMSFTAMVTAKKKKGNVMLLYTKLTSDIEKIQRRKYYRLDCNLHTLYRVYPEQTSGQENIQQSDLPEFKKAITRNMSGNGACIVTEESIPKGLLIEVQIYLSENNPITALGIVMRSSTINASKGKKYELGLYFQKVSGKDQDNVVRFIFDQQRLLLKRST